MIRIGKKCVLDVMRLTKHGAFLEGGPYGDILLPNRYVQESLKEDDEIEVFISFDSEDRLVATTDFPFLMVDEIGVLEVVDVNKYGAFMDWGLPKNLFVPFKEQQKRMEKGKRYVVAVYIDKKTGRIAASSKIQKFLSEDEVVFEAGEKVSVQVCDQTDMGYVALINGCTLGLLYENEIFKPVDVGDELDAYIKQVREDGKIDLSLEPVGYDKVDPAAQKILQKIMDNEGKLFITDKSDPKEISVEFGMSKKTFKKALGALYKQKRISILEDHIQLNSGSNTSA